MENSKQLSNRFTEVMLNGKWIANTNYHDQLSNLNFQQATKRLDSLITIAILSQHVNYYISGLLDVFKGRPLLIRDADSFDFPKVNSEKEWENCIAELLNNSKEFAKYIEAMTEAELDAIFVKEEYGTFRRNIEGVIEHCYYHLGQISLIKKMILNH